MTRKITLAPGEFYHIYNRGTEKIKIFHNKNNYLRFLTLLYLCNSELPVTANFRGSTSNIFQTDRGNSLIEICAYCLMPNHFHLILKEKEDGGVSKFMQKLITGYTMYFNKSNDRSGSLFQGRFKAVLCDNDEYLSYLIAYIHLNPIKLIDSKWKENGIRNRSKAEKFLDQYEYSSFIDYCNNKRPENKIINFDSLPSYFETPANFKKNVTNWLSFKDVESPEVQPR